MLLKGSFRTLFYCVAGLSGPPRHALFHWTHLSVIRFIHSSLSWQACLFPQGDFIYHMRKAHLLEPKPLRCPQCEDFFCLFPSQLKQHLTIKHNIEVSIGWFLKRFHFVFLESSWFPRKKMNSLQKAKTKCYLWASFHDIWSLSNLSKLDIQKAISAKKIMIWKSFLCKNKLYIVVVLQPNFYLFARSSSFSLAFFLHVYGELF